MIKPGDTYTIKDNDDIKKLIRQTDGTRLTEEQSKKLTELIHDKELHDCFDCEGCICEEYCKEQDKIDFPDDYKRDKPLKHKNKPDNLIGFQA